MVLRSPAWFFLQIARFFRARLYHKCMRSVLALLTALVSLISPARAQSPLLNSGLLNLGLAFPTATSKPGSRKPCSASMMIIRSIGGIELREW